MRRVLLALFALPLLACPRKKIASTDDAAADAGATAAVVDAGPEATNDGQIARYGDEQAIDHTSATIKAPKATAMTSAPKGATVATLKNGDTVTELAEHNGYYRVLFPDPKDGTKKLMGWVVKFAFDEPPPPPKKAPVPKCSDVLASAKASPIVPFCTKMCADDKDCTSSTCESALILDAKGQPAVINGYTHFESVCMPPKAAAKDGGAAKKPAAVPDCKGEDRLFAVSEKSPPFCAHGDDCKTDKDCKGGTCLDLVMLEADGQPMLDHNGSMIGGKFCKPK